MSQTKPTLLAVAVGSALSLSALPAVADTAYGKLGYVRLLGNPGIDTVKAVSRADGRERTVHYRSGEDKSYGRVQLGVSGQLTSGLSAYVHGDTTFVRRERNSAVHLGVQYRF